MIELPLDENKILFGEIFKKIENLQKLSIEFENRISSLEEGVDTMNENYYYNTGNRLV